MTSPAARMPAPAGTWPTEDLERVASCPACGGAPSGAWREGLVDDVFSCAPGTWTLARCSICGAAWLDPRPTPDSVMRAYARYYTHDAVSLPGSSGLGPKVALRNGYLRARWGYDASPSLALGRWVVGRRRRAALDLEVRHLPRPEGRARLLDVGCGNGAFLATMKARGWEVHGLEPDPAAAAAARAAGIDVKRGTLVDVDWPDGTFRAVTMSSVIEHVHDPAGILAACRRLLAPGGLIHIVTPNIDSLGAERFGRHWRGFEAPRHLVMFNRGSLARLLGECGFEGVTFHPRYAGEWFWLASGAIERGLAPEAVRELPRDLRRALRREGSLADRRVAREPERAEELVVTARRPGPGQ